MKKSFKLRNESSVADEEKKSRPQGGLARAAFQSTNLLRTARERFLQLSRSDKKVARLLLESPGSFIRTSVSEVADAADVSQATVVRFGRIFGCRGFKDFKIELAQQLAATQALHDSGRGIEVPLQGGNFIDRICASATLALRDTACELNLEAVEAAAQLIASARRIAIYGLGGSSSSLAQELHNRLFRLDLASAAYTDDHMQRMSASVLERKDVGLFISSTGRPRSLIESAEIASHYGAKTVALTDEGSELGREVDVCLHIRLSQAGVAMEQPNPMRFAQLLVIDCLVYRVAELRGDAGRASLERVRASIAAMHGILPQQPIGD